MPRGIKNVQPTEEVIEPLEEATTEEIVAEAINEELVPEEPKSDIMTKEFYQNGIKYRQTYTQGNIISLEKI